MRKVYTFHEPHPGNASETEEEREAKRLPLSQSLV